jgi:tRNA 2-thiouridine synthesizing protein A
VALSRAHSTPGEEQVSESLDLRGVRCPLSWAKAKVRLEHLPAGALLEVLLDDPKGIRDVPRAAEAAGYVVVEMVTGTAECRLVIQK